MIETAKLRTEPNLIARAQEGDADAFATLFDTHKSRIYAVCLRMTNNAAEAEDLTQDAFIHVFRKLSSFRGDSAFSTWLYRIAVNTVLMHFRKKGGRPIPLEPSPQTDTDLPKREYGQVDNQLAGCIDRLTLARAIKELPDGYRMIFLLHEVKGYEHKEIARILKCSVGNSKSQLHKAKLRMRKLLAPRRHGRFHLEAEGRDGLRPVTEGARHGARRAAAKAPASTAAWAKFERRNGRILNAERILADVLEIPFSSLQGNNAFLGERAS